LLQPLVGPLGLPISLGMEGRADVLIDVQESAHFPGELGYKSRISVGYDTAGYPHNWEQLFGIQGCNPFRPNRFVTGQEECHFGYVVISDGED